MGHAGGKGGQRQERTHQEAQVWSSMKGPGGREISFFANVIFCKFHFCEGHGAARHSF